MMILFYPKSYSKHSELFFNSANNSVLFSSEECLVNRDAWFPKFRLTTVSCFYDLYNDWLKVTVPEVSIANVYQIATVFFVWIFLPYSLRDYRSIKWTNVDHVQVFRDDFRLCTVFGQDLGWSPTILEIRRVIVGSLRVSSCLDFRLDSFAPGEPISF